MRTIRNSFGSLAIIGGLIGSLLFVHAQTVTKTIQNGAVSLDDPNVDWASLSDVEVELKAIEATTPVAADALPFAGTFISAQHALDWPPLPGNIRNLPCWPLDTNLFLLSDLAINYNAKPKAAQPMKAMIGNMMAMDLPAPGDGGGGDTNSYAPSGSGLAVDFGTNLWISQFSAQSGNLTWTISNTIPDIFFELETRSTLLPSTPWVPTGLGMLGSEVTNWTALVMTNVSLTNNAFFRIRSWQDDGSGLPIWWQMQYLGVTGADPFSFDPSGDGFTLWQDFEAGYDPTIFHTPAAPQGLTVNYNSFNGTATVSWLPSPGGVTGYTVEKTDSYVHTVQDFNFSTNVLSFVDNLSSDIPNPRSGYTLNVSYRIVAHYGTQGDSLWSDPVPLEQNSISGSIIAGPQGSAYLSVSALPAGTMALRVTRFDMNASEVEGDFSYNTNFDIPVTDPTNSLYLIPSVWTRTLPDGYGFTAYSWWVKAINTNGNVSAAAFCLSAGHTFTFPIEDPNDYVWMVPPYFDGRQQLKQNLIFLLRAATMDYPFNFEENYYVVDNPTTYVYSDFTNPYHTFFIQGAYFDAYSPFYNNHLYRNFVFDLSEVDGNGRLQTGVSGSIQRGWTVTDPPANTFQVPATNGAVIAAVLATNDTRWLCSSLFSPGDALGEIGITYGGGVYTMASVARNIYGLPFLSAKIAYNAGGGVGTNTLYANGNTSQGGYFYPETAQPQFQTVEYDFWNANSDELPGSADFSPTNTSQQFLTSPGQQIQIAGYTKLAVQNGYSGVYAYLGQYFDKAYKEDANGIATTNATGVLSPYGYFFPTEPGPAALVTMPDVDTGTRGTCTVYCVSLVLDKNHDLVMDTSFNGPDATSQASPMIAWINNGYIKPGNNGSLDQDLPVPPNHPEYANYSAGEITCPRDLENCFRLWTCGVPQLPVGQGYAVTLSMSPVSGNPAINLYYSCETNGGTGYLTDTNIAATQTGSAYYDRALCTISNSQSYTLQMDSYGNLLYTHFLFEGAGIGEGQLTMTISQNGNTIAQTGVWLDLRDVKSLYQRVKVTPRDPNGIPGPWTSATTTFDENTAGVDTTSDGYGFSPSADESKTATVFVHGSNLSVPNALSNGDTMFKRLYWQGYHGRLILFYWNTLVGPWDGTIPAHYNYNEFRAFKYGQALKHYVENDLPAGYAKNVIGHSMGNMVVVSALYPRGSTPGMTCRNVIFMQAAVPASCLDSGATTLPELANLESPQTTPDDFASQWGYRSLLATNVNATLYNMYNTNDFALGWWVWNQHHCKPEDLGSPIPREIGTKYEWDGATRLGTLYYANGFLHRTVSDPQESVSFIARSRTAALGRMAASGSISQNQNVGVGTTFDVPFGDARADHSGEFTRPIQQLNDFYNFIFKLVD